MSPENPRPSDPEEEDSIYAQKSLVETVIDVAANRRKANNEALRRPGKKMEPALDRSYAEPPDDVA